MAQKTENNDITVHQQRRRKNWIVMGALLAFIALIWIVTMVKIAVFIG